MHTITECYYFPDSYRSFTIFLKVFTSLVIFMSVGWDVKWCPVSRITTPLARKRPSHWISMTSKLVKDARETSKLHKLLPFINGRRRYVAEILPIQRQTLYNQPAWYIRRMGREMVPRDKDNNPLKHLIMHVFV